MGHGALGAVAVTRVCAVGVGCGLRFGVLVVELSVDRTLCPPTQQEDALLLINRNRKGTPPVHFLEPPQVAP